MVHQAKHGIRTGPGTSVSGVDVDFTIDFIRVQGPARDRLRKRFGSEMRSFLTATYLPGSTAANIGVASDIGVRTRQEDSAVALAAHIESDNLPIPLTLVAVADGIGGSNDGDLASAIAIETLTDEIVTEMMTTTPRAMTRRSVENLLVRAFRAANSRIKEETDGGGTTLTCALIVDSTTYLAHVGDSRAYLLNAKRRDIELVTSDHRLVQLWQSLGIVTKEQAAHHPRRHLLYRSLGSYEKLDVDIMRRGSVEGSRLLLCTDGVSDVLSRTDLLRIVNQSGQPQEICERLIKTAVDSHSRDEATAILVKIID